MIEKFERCLLILRRVLVSVVTLVHQDAVGVPESTIEAGNLIERLVGALDGKEVEDGSGHENRTRIHQQQETSMIYTV